MEQVAVKGVSHITGGGFYENIPRSLKKGCAARIAKADVRTPALFGVLAREGNVPERDMFNTFNMGVGMTLVVAPEDAGKALEILKAHGEDAYRLGTIVEGDGGGTGMKRVAVLVSGGGHQPAGAAGKRAPRREPRREDRAGGRQQTRRVRAGTRCRLRRGGRRGSPQRICRQRSVRRCAAGNAAQPRHRRGGTGRVPLGPGAPASLPPTAAAF